MSFEFGDVVMFMGKAYFVVDFRQRVVKHENPYSSQSC